MRQKLKHTWRTRYIVSFYIKKLTEFLGDWKEKIWVGTLEQRFPWVISQAKYIYSFLSGFFDAEGWVVFKYRRHQLILCSIVPKVQRFLKKMLTKLDYKSQYGATGIVMSDVRELKRFAKHLHSTISYKEKELASFRNAKIVYFHKYLDYLKVRRLSAQGNTRQIIHRRFSHIPKGTLDHWIYQQTTPTKYFVSY